jgi:tetratricopeptide (TPR) repeat protein
VTARLQHSHRWAALAVLGALAWCVVVGQSAVTAVTSHRGWLAHLPMIPVGGKWSLAGWIPTMATAGVVVLLFARAAARSAVTGPITIGTVEDARPNAPTGEAGPGAATVAAVLRDRLARTGTGPRGLVPSTTSQLDDGTELQVLSSPLAVSGFLTRLGIQFLRASLTRQGWVLNATLRTSENDERVGLTLTIVHRATGRHELVRSIWADTSSETARQAAYVVAAWYLGRLPHASTRDRPQWQPTETALRRHEDADFLLGRRRFDEAIEAARTGLAADPSNIALRRLLGESYERLGHFLQALHTYAAGLVTISDLTNSWNASTLTARGSAHTGPPWPRRRAPVRSGEAAGLLWRYVAVLGFADTWVDRWIGDVAVAEEERRSEVGGPDASDGAPGPERRWSSVEHSERAARWPEAEPEWRREREARRDQAKRVRGFFARRYDQLLDEEFPLLNATVFAEQHDRDRPFPSPQVELRDEPPAPPGPADWLTAEIARFPLVAGRPRRSPSPGGPPAGAVARPQHLVWVLVVLHDLAVTAAGPEGTGSLGANEVPADIGSLVGEARARLQLPAGTSLLDVAGALTDPATWTALHLNRLQVAQVACYAAFHLVRLSDATGGAKIVSGDVRVRLVMLMAQLDLRLFLHRAALEEIDRLRGNVEIDTQEVAPAELVELFRLNARYRYLDRIHVIDRHPEVVEQADPGGRLSPADRRNVLRLDTAKRARDVADDYPSSRWRTIGSHRRRLPTWTVWNIYYYAACVHATVIRNVVGDGDVPVRTEVTPGRAGGPGTGLGTGHGIGPDAVSPEVLWARRFDPFAELAVRALNHAGLVREYGEASVADSGVLQWLLHEDPDLAPLRDHPRFQRWASSTFAESMIERPSIAARRSVVRFGQLRERQFRNEGVFGMEMRWRSTDRVWWLANDHFLVQSLHAVAPAIAAGWRDLGARTTEATEAELLRLRSVLIDRAELDLRAWLQFTSYWRFAARTDLRLALGRDLSALAGQPRSQQPFPVTGSALQGEIHLDYRMVDAMLGPILADARTAQADVVRISSLPGSARPRSSMVQVALSAADRWQTMDREICAAALRDPLTGPEANRTIVLDSAGAAAPAIALDGSDGLRRLTR